LCCTVACRCSHHCAVASLPFVYAFHTGAARTLSVPIAMFDGLGMFASNLFKFAQISFKFIVDTGPNFPNFVQLGALRNFSTNESQNLGIGVRSPSKLPFVETSLPQFSLL